MTQGLSPTLKLIRQFKLCRLAPVLAIIAVLGLFFGSTPPHAFCITIEFEGLAAQGNVVGNAALHGFNEAVNLGTRNDLAAFG